jgi:hypothetical protein
MTKRTRSVVATVMVAMLMPGLLAGQAQDADTKELAAYRLSMETLEKVRVAMRVTAEEAKKDPKIQAMMKLDAEIDALEKKDEPTEAESARLEKLREQREAMEDADADLGDAQTLSEMEARIRAFKPMAAGLARAGLSPRDFAKFTLAFFQAGMVAAMRKSGVTKEIPPGVSAENVKFIETHEAELKAIQEEFDRLGKGR